MTTNAVKLLPAPEIVKAVSYEGDDGKLYGYANHIDFANNPGAVPVIFMRESDLIALRSYTEDCLARLRVAEIALERLLGDPERLARAFHNTYERLAPAFGYETRPDTREFEASSKNGQLMIEVCKQIALAAIGPLEGEKQGE